MAGDWIKVEKATARKIEVVKLSSILGIHPDHGFGLCIRFWQWCDDQLVDQWISGMTPDMIDITMGHVGFASALTQVGWLKDSHGILSIPHFDRHLSKSAKIRADATLRKSVSRKNVTSVTKKRDKNETREEKRI